MKRAQNHGGSAAIVIITQLGRGYVPSWAAVLANAEVNANALFGRDTNVIASIWNSSSARILVGSYEPDSPTEVLA